jgi:hypothetical protein
LHAALCELGQKKPLPSDPAGTNGTLVPTATIAIEPLLFSSPSAFVIPQLLVKSFSTEKVSIPAGVSGHPQHSPISWSASNT